VQSLYLINVSDAVRKIDHKITIIIDVGFSDIIIRKPGLEAFDKLIQTAGFHLKISFGCRFCHMIPIL
jgi:hypothetical protein